MTAATQSDLLGFLAHLKPLGLAWLAVAFALVMVHYIAEPLRWRVLFPGTAPMTTWVSVFGLTALVSYVLPFKLGIPLRVYFLRLKMQLSLASVTGAMGLDALIYYGGWLLAGASGFVLLARRISLFDVPLAAVVAVSVLGVLAGAWVVPRMLRAIRRFDLHYRITAVLAQFTPARIALIGSIVMADILCQLLRHGALAQALDIPVGVIAIGALTAFAILAGLLIFTPMGLGGYDAIMLAGLVQFGAPFSSALILVLLNRLLTIAAAALIGGIGGWALGLNPLRPGASRALIECEKGPNA